MQYRCKIEKDEAGKTLFNGLLAEAELRHEGGICSIALCIQLYLKGQRQLDRYH